MDHVETTGPLVARLEGGDPMAHPVCGGAPLPCRNEHQSSIAPMYRESGVRTQLTAYPPQRQNGLWRVCPACLAVLADETGTAYEAARS